MKLRPFELGLVIVFIGLIIASLAFLSVYKKKPSSDGLPQIGTVAIWGTLPYEPFNNLLEGIRTTDNTYQKVTYRYIPPQDFDSVFVNALADGSGPDIIFISHEKLVSMRKRIQPISYEAFPLRDIQSRYTDGSRIFALQDGLYAYPVAVDPLLMYFNRDILSNDNFLEAPRTWESVVNEYHGTLVRRNPDRSIVRSVVAMGEYSNIENAFGTISMLLLQTGSDMVREKSPAEYDIRLNVSKEDSVSPLTVVADFYTRFAKPNNSLYSWNRSLSKDKDRFLSEELALYFGYGSEGKELEKLNPNLNFDVAEVPQGATATVRRTYGRFYGLSAVRASKNLEGASLVLGKLGSKESSETLARNYGMVPAYKESVAAGSNDTYGRIAFTSAPITYGWLSPSEVSSADVFTKMTQDLNENRSDLSNAVNDVLGRLEVEYNK
jgi:ABC-type glycerol-3-phosphate transport system substrate-binding protein